MVTIQELTCHAVGNNQADGQRMVAEQIAKAIECGAFHFHIGNGIPLILKRFDTAIQFGIIQFGTNLTTLRSKEAGRTDGDTLRHVVGDALQQDGRAGSAIGIRQMLVPTGVADERLHNIFANQVTSVVKAQHSVDAKAERGGQQAAALDVGVKRTRRADAHKVEGAMFVLHRAGFQVDIGHGIQFRQHNVDIVGTHSRGNHGDTLAMESSSMGNQFAILLPHLHRVEHGRDHLHTAGIAHQNDVIGQFLGMQIEVVDGTVALQRQFGSGYLFVHIVRGLMKRQKYIFFA